MKWNIIDGKCVMFGTNPYWWFMTDTYPTYFNEQFKVLKGGVGLMVLIIALALIRTINYLCFGIRTRIVDK